MESGSINALMRTLRINVKPVIQLTFNQTKTRMLMYALRRFSTMHKGRASLFEASAVVERRPLFCRVRGGLKKSLFWTAFLLMFHSALKTCPKESKSRRFCLTLLSFLRGTRKNASFLNEVFLPPWCFCSGNSEAT